MYNDPLKLIRGIEVWTWTSDSIRGGINFPSSQAKLLKPNFPHNCLSLDIAKNKDIKKQGVKNIYIEIYRKSGFGVELFLEDRHRSCSRTIKYSRLAQTGANIVIDDLGKTVDKKYVVKLKENVLLEEDPLAKCRNYPNKDYDSYNDCDEDFLIKIFQKYFRFYPIWVTSNKSLVTEHETVINYDTIGEGKANFYDLRDGDISTCTLPCRSSSLTCAFLSEFNKAEDNFSTIDIAFDPHVLVSSEISLALNWSGLLADLGGCMGVWLGLGAVQILQLTLGFDMKEYLSYIPCFAYFRK